jgi:hypothetical protein
MKALTCGLDRSFKDSRIRIRAAHVAIISGASTMARTLEVWQTVQSIYQSHRKYA